jgi:exodeoxyribonuclease III
MSMRIATYNVNGINGRLANLLGWLEEAMPDIVCLQELKAPDDKFPAAAIRAAGYGAVWHGQKSWNGVAILARGAEPMETRRGLPGNPDDTHSRYIEAAIGGTVVGCLYLPNGNPAPGPKFDYNSIARFSPRCVAKRRNSRRVIVALRACARRAGCGSNRRSPRQRSVHEILGAAKHRMVRY